MSKDKSIKLASLELNPENPRFDAVAGQREALDKMIADQENNLYNLANHIIKNGHNPIDKVLVINSKSNVSKYTVVEGNRRITALKILSNPDIIEDAKYNALKKRFRDLHKNNEEKFPISVPCIVLDNLKEAELWIDIKHAGLQNGVGTDTWDTIQKRRYEQKTKGKSSMSLQFIAFLKNSDSVPVDIKERVEAIRTTNVDRLLGDPYVREQLGIEFNNGVLQSIIEEKEVVKGLCKVANDMLQTDFTVKKIYDPQIRKKYIDSISTRNKPDIKKIVEKPWQLNAVKSAIPLSPSQETSNNSDKPIATKQRKNLISPKLKLNITQPRIEAIFIELQSLNINTHKNAVAVLLRVFIELSLDFYIEEKKLTQAVSSQKSGMSLRDKAFQVISSLTNQNFIDAAISKGIRNAVKDDNNILGTETWHAYVHNHRFSPIPQNMIITWDSLQEFISVLWNNIN